MLPETSACKRASNRYRAQPRLDTHGQRVTRSSRATDSVSNETPTLWISVIIHRLAVTVGAWPIRPSPAFFAADVPEHPSRRRTCSGSPVLADRQTQTIGARHEPAAGLSHRR